LESHSPSPPLPAEKSNTPYVISLVLEKSIHRRGKAWFLTEYYLFFSVKSVTVSTNYIELRWKALIYIQLKIFVALKCFDPRKLCCFGNVVYRDYPEKTNVDEK
jgi:hypothetical protein